MHGDNILPPFETIHFPGGAVTKVDRPDWDRVKDRPWRGYISPSGRTDIVYQAGSKCTRVRQFSLPRVLMNCPDDMVVDHINGDTSDNRRANLRVCTAQQNIWNTAPVKGKAVPYKGVTTRRGRFIAALKTGQKIQRLGVFATAEEAAHAYDAEAARAFGEFAWLNGDHFPELHLAEAA